MQRLTKETTDKTLTLEVFQKRPFQFKLFKPSTFDFIKRAPDNFDF